MKFLQRFKYYGIGVLLGIGFVYVLFGQRTDISCSYFPNARVLSHLQQGHPELTDRAACQLDCLELDSIAMAGFWRYGDVDFRTSEPRREPFGRYIIKHDDLDLQIAVENRDTVTVLLGFTGRDVEECDCPDW